MIKAFASVFIVFLVSTCIAQTYECEFADLGDGVVEQKLVLNEGDSTFKFTAQGENVNLDFMRKLESMIPAYDQILDIDFGPSTYIYTVDGSAVIFRKCRAVSGGGTVAEIEQDEQPQQE